MADEHRLVELGAACQHGGDKRNADTAADVAGQIDEAGGLVVFLSGKVSIGCRVDWHKQERQPGGLINTRPHHSLEVRVEVENRHVEQRQRDDYESESDEPPSVITGYQKAHEWHECHERETARRDDQPRQFSGISHQHLNELRQEHGRAIEREPDHEQH